MLTLAGTDLLSDCPGCGGRDFVRASLFSVGGLARSRSAGSAMPGTTLDASGQILASRGNAGAQRAERRTADADILGTGAFGGTLSRSDGQIDSDALLQKARGQLQEPGEYLAYEDDDGELKTVALTREWTRIGRSLVADVRFDDPTVSRRHALIVRQAEGVRVLDDRSLNGVFVNGSRIEWKALQDGDEILVGRYRLRFFSIAPTAGEASSAAILHEAG
jgi:hypothetical protein